MNRKDRRSPRAPPSSTVIAPVAGAADSPPLHRAPEGDGAYLYLDHNDAASGLVRVVFRTATTCASRRRRHPGRRLDRRHLALDRRREEGRADLHRAGQGQGHSIAALDGTSIRKGAKVGRSYAVRIFTRDARTSPRRWSCAPSARRRHRPRSAAAARRSLPGRRRPLPRRAARRSVALALGLRRALALRTWPSLQESSGGSSATLRPPAPRPPFGFSLRFSRRVRAGAHPRTTFPRRFVAAAMLTIAAMSRAPREADLCLGWVQRR